MNSGDHESSLEFQVTWPLRTLSIIANESVRRTAVVLDVKNMEAAKEHLLTSGLATALARAGIELFALVGKQSEQIHDALDWVLEEAGAEGVVTSWHEPDNPDDVAAFVVACSRASGLTRVVAVLDVSTEAGANLKDCIVKAIGVNLPNNAQ